MALYKGFSTKYYGRCSSQLQTTDRQVSGSVMSVNTGFAVRDVALVKQDLLNQFFTVKGERVMQPTFGTTIPDILFEPLDSDTLAVIESELIRVISDDPRVSLLNITLTPFTDQNTVTVNIILQYIELNVIDGFELNIAFM